MIKDQVSNLESRNTMNLLCTYSQNYVQLRETHLLSFKRSSCFESKNCTKIIPRKNIASQNLETQGSKLKTLSSRLDPH